MNKILDIYFLNKKQDAVLILLALLSLTLMLLRVKITHDIYLLFLIWNLFLGYIPYFFSSKLKNTVPGYFRFYLLLLGWILFLPNAFYLVTDFIHLHYSNSFLYLFDAILLTSFTIAGFYAGLSSLHHVHRLLEMKYSSKKSKLIVIVVCYLSSYGVYLGRILRFNSWDVLQKPVNLFYSLIDSLSNPETYAFTALLGTFIMLVYSLYFSFKNKKKVTSW
jgi:uncharacterized membrane protein